MLLQDEESTEDVQQPSEGLLPESEPFSSQANGSTMSLPLNGLSSLQTTWVNRYMILSPYLKTYISRYAARNIAETQDTPPVGRGICVRCHSKFEKN